MLFVGCNSGSMKKAVDNGVSSIKEVKEFEALFPNSDHFITYYSGTKGDPRWNSKCRIHDRYDLTMQFYISFDHSRLHPKRIGDATFYLKELKEIRHHKDGRISESYTRRQIKFGDNEWQKLVDSKGDFSVIGFPMILDEPIKPIKNASY